MMESQSWQQQMASSFTRPQELLEFLDIDPRSLGTAHSLEQNFPFRVTRFFAALMEKRNPHDPLLLQVLPRDEEFLQVQGYSSDPLGDLDAHAGAGVLKKYHGRALLIASAACAINCRYCFRRHFPYADHASRPSNWDTALASLLSDSRISELILSGGDPLSLSNDRLEAILNALVEVPHLRRLRIHSRMPPVLPHRVDQELISLLSSTRLATSLVIHVNHPREISSQLAEKMWSLKTSGITLLNQSVLLKGINDHPEVLQELSESLYAIGVLPYYIHLLDKVAGASHFLVDDEVALALQGQLRERLPGYLLPRFVREISGAGNKVPL